MIQRCFVCGKLGFGRKEHSWMYKPGSGRTIYLCPSCPKPKDFLEAMGVKKGDYTIEAKFERYIGEARITDGSYGQNAYGSVLAQYTNGEVLPVCCMHGGSMWFCLECAQKTMEEQHQRDIGGVG